MPAMRPVLVTASIAAHAAAFVAVLVLAWWNVDKLPVESPPVRDIVVLPGSPPPGAMARTPELRARKVARARPTETVQPEVRRDDEPVDEAPAGGGGGAADGAGTGPTDGTGTGVCTDPSCLGTDPTATAPPPVVEAPAPPKPVVIAPNVASGLRISGNDQIHAPDPVRTAMLRDGKTQTIGIVKVCLDTRGRVASAAMARSTGYAAYDRAILGAVRGWRYQPYRVDGEAVPACTVVNFVYRIRR